MKVVDKVQSEAMTPEQRRIYKDPEKTCRWAIKYDQRFPEAEPYIAKDPYWAYIYAFEVIKGRWSEGEKAIATDPKLANWYAMYVVKDRWPEAEKVIAKDPTWSYLYAKDVIKGRWPEGEKAIATELWWAYLYAKDVLKARWPELEEAFANTEYKDQYLQEFPEAREDWAANGWIDWLDT